MKNHVNHVNPVKKILFGLSSYIKEVQNYKQMKEIKKILIGLIVVAIIFGISTYLGAKINFGIEFISKSFGVHLLMLLFSFSMIYLFKDKLTYKISLPKFKTVVKPILFALLLTIIINITGTVIGKLFGQKIEIHALLSSMNPMQILIFVFFMASVSEEFLFRGFLLNYLKPLSNSGITIFHRKISTPVIISGLVFGLAHIILFVSGASLFFALRVVFFTAVLGIVAGYYQEKYDNHAYAIIVHMSANFMGFISALILSFT